MAMSESSSGQAAPRVGVTPLIQRTSVFWWLAILCFTAFILTHLQDSTRLADLSNLGADDGLRLQEVRDLMAGQSWFDMHQYRYLPPDGTLMHWSRLIDAPLAGALWLLTPLAGQALAERIVLTAWPILLIAAYLAIAAAGLARTFNQRAAALAAIATLSLMPFQSLFAAGAIDHHNVQIVLILAAVLSFSSAASKPEWAIAGGFAAALSLAIGLEGLPFAACIGAAFAIAWIVDARQARAFALFGGALAVTSFAAFFIQTAPSLWLVPACDALSAPWLILTGGAGFFAFALTAFGRRLASPQQRLVAGMIGGVVIVAIFVTLFPECLAGPYGSVPERIRDTWLRLTGESIPLTTMVVELPAKTALVFGPALAATIAAWCGAWMTRGEERRLLLLSAVLLTLTLLLSFLQIRAIYLGCAVIPIAAGWGLDRALRQATLPGTRVSRSIPLLLAALLLVQPPWSFAEQIASAATPLTEATPGGTLTPVCFNQVAALDDLPRGTILAPMDLGAHILFMTDQPMIAAGYHRNVEGILAGIEAFAGSEADLRDTAMRLGADYVALCLPWIELRPKRYGSFVHALSNGTARAEWLEPVAVRADALKVWKVRREPQP